MRRDVVAGFAVGLLLTGEVVSEKHGPYWLAPDHSHTEIPAGNINFNNRISVDSGAATSTASTGVLNLLPALALGE